MIGDCLHDIDPAWCSLCRAAAGYQPGSDRHENDCTVRAVEALTGASYAEAVDLLAGAGRRAGQGAYSDTTAAALTAAGWDVTETKVRLGQVLGQPGSGSWFVSARRGRNGHAFAVIDGVAFNAGGYTRPGTVYRMFRVA